MRLPLFLITVLPVSLVACSSATDAPSSNPTILTASASALTVCGVEMTSFSLDTDLSGPYVVVSMGDDGHKSDRDKRRRHFGGGYEHDKCRD